MSEFKFSNDQWKELILAWETDGDWPEWVASSGINGSALRAFLQENVKSLDFQEGADGKIAWTSAICFVPCVNLYFRVDCTQENRGYWGDGERYPPEIEQVEPYEEMVVKYRSVAKNLEV